MNIPYLNRISQLKNALEEMGSPAKLNLPFVPGRPPTQAFSEFLTNKEQGDWAEKTFITNFNIKDSPLWAVKYGRSEDIIAGDIGFAEYYTAYQEELAVIGKRPDLLLFDRNEFMDIYGNECVDISNFSRIELDELVPKAQLAIEVRSSAFISNKYYDAASLAKSQYIDNIANSAKLLKSEYYQELQKYSPDWLNFATELAIGVSGISFSNAPRAFSRKSTERLQQASELSKIIKENLKSLAQRDFLSITPKAEDLSLVYRWLEKYKVPHYYCQVFFDQAVIISFEQILEILANSDREDIDYYIEADEKNQRKTTFKINIRLGALAMCDISLPAHRSVMKELPKGRLLFFVSFDASQAKIVTDGWLHV